MYIVNCKQYALQVIFTLVALNYFTSFHIYSSFVFSEKMHSFIIPHWSVHVKSILMHIRFTFRALFKICLNSASFSADIPAFAKST